MKKIILSLLVFCSVNAFSYVDTMINWGPFLNCQVMNNTNFLVRINSVRYIMHTNFGTTFSDVICTNNCFLAPYRMNRFNGPINNRNIISANCLVNFSY